MVEVIEKSAGKSDQTLSYILSIGNGNVEEIISYNQLVDHLEAAANEDNKISYDLYKSRALIDHQGPSILQIPIGKGANTMSLLVGKLGRRPMNLSQFWQQMIQYHVQLMPKREIFYILLAGKVQEPCKEGQNPNQRCHGVQNQESQEIKQIHVWLPHP